MAEISRSFELNQNQKYVVRVRSQNNFNVTSEWSDSIVVSTDGFSFDIDRPYGLEVSSGIRSLFLSWNAVSDPLFSHYEIYVSKTPFNGVVLSQNKYGDFIGTFASVNKVWDSNLNQSVDLTPGNVYYIVMRSVSKDGTYSGFSSEVSAETGYVGNADLVVESISGEKIQAATLSADKITTGKLTAEVTLTGKMLTASSGARVEIDSSGIRGYNYVGSTPNFDYSTGTGNVVVRGDITAAGFFGEKINLNDKNNWSLNEVANIYYELISNGNFDSGITGWQSVSGCSIAQETSVYRSGTGSLKITRSGTGDSLVSTLTGAQAIPINDHTTYTISFYCRRAGATARNITLTVDYYKSNGDLIPKIFADGDIVAAPTNTDWSSQGTGQLHPPPGAAYAAVVFRVAAGTNGEIFYIDDVSIRPSIVGWSLGDIYSYTLTPDITTGSKIILTSRDTTSANRGGSGSCIAYTVPTQDVSKAIGTVTISIASPAVVTKTNHGLAADTAIYFSTTGSLPTGLSANTIYYVKSPLTNSFNVSSTKGGTAINTSGTQSGTHYVYLSSWYGAADSYEYIFFGGPIPTEPKRSYKASFWAKRSDATTSKKAHVLIRFYDSSFNLISTLIANTVSLTNTWSQYFCTVRITQSNVAYMKIGLQIDSGAPMPSTTSLYVDDLYIEQIPYIESGFSAPDTLIVQSDTLWDRTGFVMPVGAIIPWAGSFLEPPDIEGFFNSGPESPIEGGFIGNIPAGWIPCDGRELRISTWPRLYAVIGTTYNVTTPTSGNFKVPDLRGRVPVCLDRMSSNQGDAGRLDVANALGDSGGAQKHTLVVSEMPKHNHTTGEAVSGSGFIAFGLGSQGVSTTTGDAGGNGAHNNMQPYILLNYLIKA